MSKKSTKFKRIPTGLAGAPGGRARPRESCVCGGRDAPGYRNEEDILRFATRRREVFGIAQEAAFALEIADLMGLYRARVVVTVPGIDGVVVFPRIIDAPQDTNPAGGPDGKSNPVARTIPLKLRR